VLEYGLAVAAGEEAKSSTRPAAGSIGSLLGASRCFPLPGTAGARRSGACAAPNGALHQAGRLHLSEPIIHAGTDAKKASWVAAVTVPARRRHPTSAAVARHIAITCVFLVEGPSDQRTSDTTHDRPGGTTAQGVPEQSTASTAGDGPNGTIAASAMARGIATTGPIRIMTMRVPARAAITLIGSIALSQDWRREHTQPKRCKPRSSENGLCIKFDRHRKSLQLIMRKVATVTLQER
jgi:hypothetical protein